jgi:DegV family protein with EDD domain
MMIKTGIVTDSHSGIGRTEADELNIRVLPMPFYFDDVCYFENVTMNHDEFFAKLKGGSDAKTSQPSIESIKNIWNEALKEFEEIVYIPISSGLSGACMTAMAMAQEDEYEGKVFVVDNGRVSTPMHRSVLDAVELVNKGYSAAKVKEILEKNREKMIIYVAVDSLEYLKRGGRISGSTAVIGNLLNIKPILKFDVGLLDVYKKSRGFNKAKKEMIDAMKEELNTRFKAEYESGQVHLLAASSSSEEDTAAWVAEIKENFPDMEVMCDNLSFGVACHIGPGGLGIGCSCVPVE